MKSLLFHAPLGAGFEVLEDRSLPAAFGVPWADPNHLTISFVGDGTATPGGASDLFRTLDAVAPTAVWQQELLRAFQTWAAAANIDIGLVADGGQALGTAGAIQGDPRFGDIRVSAAALSPNVVASATPFTWAGSTNSGDLVLSTGQPFAIGDVSGRYDLYSVALHEAGHTLGLDHSTAADSVMHEDYAFHAGLGASDIAAIRALYGARAADANEGSAGNNTITAATVIPKVKDGPIQLAISGDLTTLSDVDFYKFTVPKDMAVAYGRIKTAGSSLFTPSATLYDPYGRVVMSAVTTDPLNNDLSIRFDNPVAATYYLKVEHGSANAFGVGQYQIVIDLLKAGQSLPASPPPAAPTADGHKNDTIGSATKIDPKTQSDARFDASYRGKIEDATDVDFYRIRSPKVAAGTTNNLDVVVWGLDATPLTTRVRVYDKDGKAVAFQVLANDVGVFSIQVANVKSDADYVIQVSARTPGEVGGYFLGVDFNTAALVAFTGIATNTLDPGTTDSGTLTIGEGGAFQFALGADVLQSGSGTIRMTVFDAAGTVVFTLDAVAGQPPSAVTRYLAAGTYTIQYSAWTAEGVPATVPIVYSLWMLQLSENVGTFVTTTTNPPDPASPPPPPAPPAFSYLAPSAIIPFGYWYSF